MSLRNIIQRGRERVNLWAELHPVSAGAVELAVDTAHMVGARVGNVVHAKWQGAAAEAREVADLVRLLKPSGFHPYVPVMAAYGLWLKLRGRYPETPEPLKAS